MDTAPGVVVNMGAVKRTIAAAGVLLLGAACGVSAGESATPASGRQPARVVQAEPAGVGVQGQPAPQASARPAPAPTHATAPVNPQPTPQPGSGSGPAERPGAPQCPVGNPPLHRVCPVGPPAGGAASG